MGKGARRHGCRRVIAASSEWHWEQGTKYAVESIKTALLVNGAAGIVLMTFANVQNLPSAVIYPLFSFATEAMLFWQPNVTQRLRCAEGLAFPRTLSADSLP